MKTFLAFAILTLSLNAHASTWNSRIAESTAISAAVQSAEKLTGRSCEPTGIEEVSEQERPELDQLGLSQAFVVGIICDHSQSGWLVAVTMVRKHGFATYRASAPERM